MDAQIILNWISAAAVVTAASIFVNWRWERRKLTRSERSSAYADFLDAFSRRWRAFGDRDGARRRNDEAELLRSETRVNETRDELYDAYVRIQILGSQALVESALECVRLSDQRNRSFKDPARYPGVGADKRSGALARFVAAARKDLGLSKLDVEALRAKD